MEEFEVVEVIFIEFAPEYHRHFFICIINVSPIGRDRVSSLVC